MVALQRSYVVLLCFSYLLLTPCHSFSPLVVLRASNSQFTLFGSKDPDSSVVSNDNKKKDNKAMAFLRKIGKVGGRTDFTHAIGVDEGPSGKAMGSKPLKARQAFPSCTKTGVIDDMSETFPTTSCGSQWAGYTDRVMGGVSTGNLCREEFDGRTANVLRGSVSLLNNGGFVQMAANLVPDSSEYRSVDASDYKGVEVDVQYKGKEEKERLNVHIKTEACQRPFSSYRASFDAPNGEWKTLRLPWTEFEGHGPGAVDAPLDISKLTRAGIVAIGKEMQVTLAVSGFRFY